MTAVFMAFVMVASGSPLPGADIDIKSDTLTVEHLKRQAVFSGGVTAVRHDFTFKCPSVTATYDERSRVRLVRCDGPVTATQGERNMTAGSGELDNLSGKLTLRGAPTLTEGGRRLAGEELVYHLASEKAELLKARAILPAQEASIAARNSGQGPLAVRSERLLYDSKAQSATFMDGVVATRGDMVLEASRLLTFHDQLGRVERATSVGKVIVVDGDRRAEAGKATFIARENVLVLEDAPRLTENDSTVVGERVTFILGEDRVVVDRPRATFPLKVVREGTR